MSTTPQEPQQPLHPLDTFDADHPLVAAVRHRFQAAGGRWAALQELPLRRLRVHQEMEAILREHHRNPQVLLREVLGYLDLAMLAAAHSEQTTPDPAGPPPGFNNKKGVLS